MIGTQYLHVKFACVLDQLSVYRLEQHSEWWSFCNWKSASEKITFVHLQLLITGSLHMESG